MSYSSSPLFIASLAFGAQWVAPGNSPEYFFADDYTSEHAGPVAQA